MPLGVEMSKNQTIIVKKYNKDSFEQLVNKHNDNIH